MPATSASVVDRVLKRLPKRGALPAATPEVRAFAKARRLRAKTDRLDAALIAQWGAACGHDRPAPDLRWRALAQHLTYHEQLSRLLAQARTRATTFTDPAIRAEIAAEIRDLTRRKRQALRRLLELVRARPSLGRRLTLLRGIPGLGPLGALSLLERVPELGTLSRRAVASLVGVGPYARDTGTRAGTRRVAHGRARVRRMLYMAALAGRRCNPDLKAFLERLVGKGKARQARPHRLPAQAPHHRQRRRAG